MDRIEPRPFRRCSVVLLLALCTLATGCASWRRPPSDLDLNRAGIVADPADPTLVLDGPSGKATGALGGAAAGTGLGFLVGMVAALPCLGTGLFAAACVSTVVPASTAIGAAGGATLGVIRAEGADAVEQKRMLLATELRAATYQDLLAAQVRQQARERLDLDLPVLPEADRADRWLLEVSLTQVAAERNAPGQPFALRVEGRLKLRRAGGPEVVYEASHRATSLASFTTEQWRANEAEAVRAGLTQGLRQLADEMLDDLVRAPSGVRPVAPRPTVVNR